MKAPHGLFQLNTKDKSVSNSPLEGGERVVPMTGWTVLSAKGQPPGSLRCRPP